MEHIYYKSGFKYQLAGRYAHILIVNPKVEISTEFINLSIEGTLRIKSGYAWDGASGPTIDTKSSMRASLVHDALYQLLRLGLLPNPYRTHADREFYFLCRKDGMSWLRAKIWYAGVRYGAKSAASPQHIKKPKVAP